MPIYEFKCKKCGDVFEFFFFRNGEGNKPTCPSCGGAETDRVLSTFSSNSSSSSQGLNNNEALSSCSPAGGFS